PFRTVLPIDGHVERYRGAVASDPIHVDALEIVLLLAVHRVEIKAQSVERPELEAHDRVDTILVARLNHRTAEPRDQRIVDLLDRQTRIVREQEVAIDRGPRRQPIARIAGYGTRYGPIAATGRVALDVRPALRRRQAEIGRAAWRERVWVHWVA